MKNLKATFILLSTIFVTACSADKWDGFVYPNKSNLTKHVYIGEFRSLKQCRAAALVRLSAISSIDKGDYECGLNCRVNDYGLYICKKTLR